MNRLQVLLSNKHTTGAAVLYALCELASIWFPDFKPQLDATKSWALVYGLLLAGDSKPLSGSNETKIITPPPGEPPTRTN